MAVNRRVEGSAEVSELIYRSALERTDRRRQEVEEPGAEWDSLEK